MGFESIKIPSDLPDGVIDSAGLYFLAIREKAAMDDQLVDDAIAFLEREAVEKLRLIDADWEQNRRRYFMAYFTGALLGARVSWRRYLMHLREKDWNAKKALSEAGGDPTAPV